MKHLFVRPLFLALLLVLCCASHADAAPAPELNYSSFGLLPVLHEGRVKPLDSYARILLRDMSGNDVVKSKPAIEWMAASLFDPAAAEIPLFAIADPALRTHLGLEKHKTRFALTELVPAFQSRLDEIEGLLKADEKTLTAQQNALLDLHRRVREYSELLRSFSSILPLNIDIPAAYKNGAEHPVYLDYMKIQGDVETQVYFLVRKKGANPAKYTDKERQLANFAFALEDVKNGGAQNDALKIIFADGQWLSPWQFLLQQEKAPPAWQTIATAYRENDAAEWLAGTRKAHPPGSPDFRLKLERLYNVVQPFHSSMGFYFLGMVILAAEIYRKSRRLMFPFICLGLGLLTHISGIAARIIILERPPVGTLYESLLFVSLICVLSALPLYFARRNFAALFAGLGSAALLLFIAPYMLQQGDGLEMLVAVLNTSFWLGTHVLCITAGYGVSILTAFLAHAYFVLRLQRAPLSTLMPLQTGIYKISLIALLLTGIGTILGGIWADQSWGRFWGWDPKENGALLIVLWIIWMQHGRVAGKLGPNAFIAAAAFLNVIVALAWFGVNLLSVGLHSYGFISGIALALFLFCALETVLIGALWRLNEVRS